MALRILSIASLMILLAPINAVYARHGWWVEEHAKALHEEYPIYTIRSSIKGIGDYYRGGRVATTDLQRDYVDMINGDTVDVSASEFTELVTSELLATGKSDLVYLGTLNAHTWTGRTVRNPQDGSDISASDSRYVRLKNSDTVDEIVAYTRITTPDTVDAKVVYTARHLYSDSEKSKVIKALYVQNYIMPKLARGESFRINGFGNFSIAEIQTKTGYSRYIRFTSSDGLEKELGD